MLITYRFFTQAGELVCQGTAKECADRLGVTVTTIRERASKPNTKNKKYLVEVIGKGEKQSNKKLRTLAKQWDEFITPIREEFGVPVYKGAK